MLKKLRRKFILINMLLVTAVLAAVFSVICYSTYSSQVNDSMNAMRMALEQTDGGAFRPEIGKKPDGEIDDGFGMGGRGGIFKAVFTATVDSGGSITDSMTDNVSVTDDVLKEAVTEALASGEDSGILGDLGLRFMISDADETGSRRIAFLDRSEETASMKELILTSLAVGGGSLVVLFIISVLFSGWAMRPVREAWDRQRQFIADASHELKTPLTVMLMNNSIISAHPEETVAQQQKWLDSSAEEGARMKKLIGDMLYLARSDAARTAPVLTDFSLSDAVWNRILPFESAAYEKGVELESSVAPDLTVRGDEEQVKQLLGILLDNAVKYAGEKGRVDVVLEKSGERAVLSVKNTGDPIPAEDIPHIFERFYRSDKSRARTEGGYGLGLAIASTIAETNKIKLSVQSSAEKGTVFTATFPPAK